MNRPISLKTLFSGLRNRTIILMVLGIVGLSYFFYDHIFIKISLVTDTYGNFKIYFPDKNGEYFENNSTRVKIRPQQPEYFIAADRIEGGHHIRIDPIDQVGHVKIKNISFYQFPARKIDIISDKRFDSDLTTRIEPVGDIASFKTRPTYIEIATSGIDSQIKVAVDFTKDSETTFIFAFFLILVSFLVYFLKNIIAYRLDSFTFVPVLMCMALVLILVMAVISKPQVHPDENIHIKSAMYYSENWMPPKICQPNMKWAYSPYGVSRLNSFEAFYFFAGKYYTLAKVIPGQFFFQFRSFNVMLFAILTLMAFLRPEFRLCCLPLLISPQIWYVFSYFNSDAFALFICYLLLYQLFISDSLLNIFLKHRDKSLLIIIGGIVVGGSLFGMLPFIKKNYYAFIIYLFCFGIIKMLSNRENLSKVKILNWGIILFVGLFLVFARYGVDAYINGLDHSHKENICRETLAKYKFKPSTPAKDQWFGIDMRKKGVALAEVFSQYGWGRISFQSTFGVYGPMSIYPSNYIISIYKIILLCFGGIIIFCAFKGGLFAWMHVLNFIFWGFLLIFASLWNSWNVDLQSQGRYFFPFFVMGAMLLDEIKLNLPKSRFSMLSIFTFFVGAYSFIFIGLARIPKI